VTRIRDLRNLRRPVIRDEQPSHSGMPCEPRPAIGTLRGFCEGVFRLVQQPFALGVILRVSLACDGVESQLIRRVDQYSCIFFRRTSRVRITA